MGLKNSKVGVMPKVLSLRPLKDFYDLGVCPSEKLFVYELDPSHPSLREKISSVDAVILPAVGIKIDSSLFDNSKVLSLNFSVLTNIGIVFYL